MLVPTISDTMQRYIPRWRLFMDNAVNDESWKWLISNVLVYLIAVMKSTDDYGDIIDCQPLQADQMVDNFSDQYFKEWKEGVRKGIQHGDWEDLLEHRTCQT
jgi:hypothetical protein